MMTRFRMFRNVSASQHHCAQPAQRAPTPRQSMRRYRAAGYAACHAQSGSDPTARGTVQRWPSHVSSTAKLQQTAAEKSWVKKHLPNLHGIHIGAPPAGIFWGGPVQTFSQLHAVSDVGISRVSVGSICEDFPSSRRPAGVQPTPMTCPCTTAPCTTIGFCCKTLPATQPKSHESPSESAKWPSAQRSLNGTDMTFDSLDFTTCRISNNA